MAVMQSNALPTRIRKELYKEVRFDGGVGSGAEGDILVARVTPWVYILSTIAWCEETLVSAGGGSISMGTPNAAVNLITTTLASTILAGYMWRNATPTPEVGVRQVDNVSANVILRVTTSAITAGKLRIVFRYHAMTPQAVML